jgi:hypothetical protein
LSRYLGIEFLRKEKRRMVGIHTLIVIWVEVMILEGGAIKYTE